VSQWIAFRDLVVMCGAANSDLAIRRLPVLQRSNYDVAAYWLAAPSMRFRDLTSPALRGLPSQSLTRFSAASSVPPNLPLVSLQAHLLRRGGVRKQEDLGSPSTTHTNTSFGPFQPAPQAALTDRTSGASHGLLGSSRRHQDWSSVRDAVASSASSRVCLTQHLPLPVFLTPSGVCSSRSFRGFISCRCRPQDFQHQFRKEQDKSGTYVRWAPSQDPRILWSQPPCPKTRRLSAPWLFPWRARSPSSGQKQGIIPVTEWCQRLKLSTQPWGFANRFNNQPAWSQPRAHVRVREDTSLWPRPLGEGRTPGQSLHPEHRLPREVGRDQSALTSSPSGHPRRDGRITSS